VTRTVDIRRLDHRARTGGQRLGDMNCANDRIFWPVDQNCALGTPVDWAPAAAVTTSALPFLVLGKWRYVFDTLFSGFVHGGSGSAIWGCDRTRVQDVFI
jgi:hypothetical protein